VPAVNVNGGLANAVSSESVREYVMPHVDGLIEYTFNGIFDKDAPTV
jgi:hypothetical protein